MKRFLAIISVILLSSSMVSCDNKEKKEWTPGLIEGNTYISEFGEIKFTIGDEWIFDKEPHLNQVTWYDLSAKYGLEAVSIMFRKADDPKKTSAKEDLEKTVSMLEALKEDGWEFGDVNETIFCGKEFYFVDGTLDPEQARIYARTIGDYVMLVDIYSCLMDVAEIEAMFSEFDPSTQP